MAEYLRLAYQGLRAKDPTFHALRTARLAPALGLVPAVAPDLGRVLLNLFTNAFQAVRERRQAIGPAPSAYRPEVGVSTRAVPAGVEIRIRDNGIGMPEAVRQRIFQPFFTTKPAGEGTGLGLSLSFDIVTTGHGGTLVVESEEGVGTEFVVTLPA